MIIWTPIDIIPAIQCLKRRNEPIESTKVSQNDSQNNGGNGVMAIKGNVIQLTKKIDFESTILDALNNYPNFATSVSGNIAKCEEISAPTVGMGFNKWTRGRAYTTITYVESQLTINVETEINGFTGGAFNGKFAQEICDAISSKIKNQIHKDSQLKPNNNISSFSAADEIIKFKNLLDQGIISQEEFDKKKKELLGL